MFKTPERIVCLSAEAADWLWRIGAWDQVAGITAYYKQSESVSQRPRISGFSSANIDRIVALDPDLVITFSDVQASIAAQLIQRGIQVLATNQRTIAEIEKTLALLARIVDREKKAKMLLNEFHERIAPVKDAFNRPQVYFEEWDAPLVSGIGWVSELIQRAGGTDVFSTLRSKHNAAERIVGPHSVRKANPDIIFASWCGKPVEPAQIASRPGWNDITAVRENRIHEVPAPDILQPGFQLVQGYQKMSQIIAAWRETKHEAELNHSI